MIELAFTIVEPAAAYFSPLVARDGRRAGPLLAGDRPTGVKELEAHSDEVELFPSHDIASA